MSVLPCARVSLRPRGLSGDCRSHAVFIRPSSAAPLRPAVPCRLPTSARLSRRVLRRDALASGGGAQSSSPSPSPPDSAPTRTVSPSEAFAFLAGSSAFSAAVTALSVWLASWLLPAAPPLLPALLAKPDVLLSLVWTLPLAASLAATLYGCSLGIPELLELKRVLTRSLLPLLRAVPPAGITLVALGAGVSEEALFRGVLLPWGTAQLMGIGWAAAPAFALASLASSICFGSLHAVTRLYFAWATAAGLLFCSQLAVTKSLSACLLTHFIYDVIAMGVLTQLWDERDAALPKPVL